MSTTIRPLRRRLPDEAVTLMDEERAAGLTPLPAHMMVVIENGTTERGRTLCDSGLGEWVTGDAAQVTCRRCLEWLHA